MKLAKRHRNLSKLLHGATLSLLLLAAARLPLAPKPWVPEAFATNTATSPLAIEGPMPDFAAILDVEAKKQAFFDYLQPVVEAQNQRVARQRMKLLNIITKVGAHTPLNTADQIFLRALSRTYGVNTSDLYTTSDLYSSAALQLLLLRVDVIPPSLVLAQAADESAWGTSRFVKEGYSFFGQWCYREGCGLVPEQRRASAYHEVQRFASLEAAVNAYFMNLNTFDSYRELRQIRQQLRDHSAPIDGLSLAGGLIDYSERGAAYISELRQIIRDNDLLRHDYNYAEAEAAVVTRTY
jgi:Bax protein